MHRVKVISTRTSDDVVMVVKVDPATHEFQSMTDGLTDSHSVKNTRHSHALLAILTVIRPPSAYLSFQVD